VLSILTDINKNKKPFSGLFVLKRKLK